MASLFKRNGVYYLAMFVDGKRMYRSTKARTKSEALRFLVDFKQGVEHRKNVLLSQLLRDFGDFSKNNHARITSAGYIRHCKRFLSFVGDRNISALTPLDYERYKSSRIGKLKVSSINTELRALKVLMGYAVKWQLLAASPFSGVTMLRVPEQAPAYLTREQAQALLDVIKNDSLRDLITVALYTGLRRSEVVPLKWESVDLANRMIIIKCTPTYQTKTGRTYRIPINEVVWHILSQPRKHPVYCFTSSLGQPYDLDEVTRRFKAYARKAKLSESIHFHSLRHTAAIWLCQAGVPLFDVQKLLNHSNIATTAIYAHLSPEHLRQSVEKLVDSRN